MLRLNVAVPVHAGSTRVLIALRDCIQARTFGQPRTRAGVAVTVRATFAMPTHWGEKRRANALARNTLHKSAPDVAEIARAVCLSLVGLVVVKRAQVVSVDVHKDWGVHHRLEVEVSEVPTE